MSLVKYNPTRSFNGLMDQFFEAQQCADRSIPSRFSPAVNVVEHETKFDIDIAAPGLEKENFSIELEGSKLSVVCEIEEKEFTGTFKRKEFESRGFKRSFTLPNNVKAKDIECAYTQGILNISVPKIPREKLVKTINIK